jgi:hypothetical protein
LLVKVPELGDIVSPGETAISNSKLQGVPPAAWACPPGTTVDSRNVIPTSTTVRVLIRSSSCWGFGMV